MSLVDILIFVLFLFLAGYIYNLEAEKKNNLYEVIKEIIQETFSYILKING